MATKREIATFAIKAVAQTGVTSLLGHGLGFIYALTTKSKMERMFFSIGTFVVGWVVSDKLDKYIDEQIDCFLKGLEEPFEEVKEEKDDTSDFVEYADNMNSEYVKFINENLDDEFNNDHDKIGYKVSDKIGYISSDKLDKYLDEKIDTFLKGLEEPFEEVKDEEDENSIKMYDSVTGKHIFTMRQDGSMEYSGDGSDPATSAFVEAMTNMGETKFYMTKDDNNEDGENPE